MAEGLRHRFGSVRVRVTAVAVLAVVAVLAIASVLLVVRQRTALVEQLDESLAADADRVAATIESTGQVPAFDVGDDDRLLVVTDSAGTVVGAADVGDDANLDEVPVTGDDRFGEVTIDGDRFRVAAAEYDTPEGRPGRVVVAGPVEDVDESIDELTTSLALIVPGAAMLLAAVVWFVVGRTLRPVERIRTEVAAIGLTELDRRVPVPDGDDEISRLATTMNEMLARLEASAQRQQRFVADSSHELRTPLTRMRAELEVDERNPERADAAATRRSVLDEIGGLQRMIEDLLLLARADAGGPGREDGLVDLDDLVLDEIRTAGASAVTIDAGAVSGAQVVGDAGELGRVVRNLIDNARRHARSSVRIELGERDG